MIIHANHAADRVPDIVSKAIHACARGCYQAALLAGRQNWAGSDLSGKANKYGSHYARSRAGLIARIEDAIADYDWSVRSELVYHGSPKRWRRELVLISPDGERLIW